MKILGIDTSLTRESVAVIEDGAILNQLSSPETAQPSREVFSMVDNILKMELLTIDDIETIAITIGPGSFTGLKIGLAMAKGLALPNNIPIVPISTLEAVVASYGLEGRVTPIVDGRAKIIYSATYVSAADGGYDCVVKEDAFSLDELSESVKEKTIFVGDGLTSYGEELTARLGDLAIIPEEPPRFSVAAAAALLSLSSVKEGTHLENKDIKPRYIVKPLPERN